MRYWMIVFLVLFWAGTATAQNAQWPAGSVKFSDGENLQAKWNDGEVTSISAADCSAVTTGTLGMLCQETADDSLWRCTTTTCNAAGWEQVGGGGGGSQTPWTQDIDADGYNLLDFGDRITGRQFVDPNETLLVERKDKSDYGWQIGMKHGNPDGFVGGTRDSIFGIRYNSNSTMSNSDCFFAPSFDDTIEAVYLPAVDDGIDSPMFERHWTFLQNKHTVTFANSTNFAQSDYIVVREPTNGTVLAWGQLEDAPAPGASDPLDVIWYQATDCASNVPEASDEIESTITTTVTSRSGSFVHSGSGDGGIVVYDTGTCGTTEADVVARLMLTQAPGGGGDDLTFIQTEGAGTDLTGNPCIRQIDSVYDSGTTALLGSITKTASTTIASIGSVQQTTNRFLTSTYNVNDMTADINFRANKEENSNGNPSFAIGGRGIAGGVPYVRIASCWTSPGGLDIAGVIGCPSNIENFAIHGEWWLYEEGSGNDRVQLGAPTATTGIRTQKLGDYDGILAGFDASGLPADNAVPRADGATAKLQTSGVSITDGNAITGASNLSCDGSYRYVGDSNDSNTSISSSKATLNYTAGNLVEIDGDGCWAPTSGKMEFLFTQSGASNVTFDVVIGTSSKFTGTTQATTIFLEQRSGASCLNGAGSSVRAKRQMVSAGSFYGFFQPISMNGTVTLSSGDYVCINVSVASGSETWTVRDFNVIFRRRPQ